MGFSIELLDVLAAVACASFFANGARGEGRSPVLWGGASLAAWFFFAGYVGGGMLGGLASQCVLFAGITLLEMRREKKRASRGAQVAPATTRAPAHRR